LVFVALVCVTLSTSDASGGPLVEQDLYSPDDGLVSRDAARGVDWLDLPLTLGLSIDDVLQGAGGWVSQGWQLASTAQVCGLARDAFAPWVACPTGSSASIAFDDRAVETIQLLGITAHGDYELIGSLGFFDDGDLSDGEAAHGGYFFLVGPDGDQSQFNWTDNGGPSTSARSPESGVFLVRPIPEPATGSLVAIGLIAFAAHGRGQRTIRVQAARAS
jgi:hypothetical protein